ncbi:MAG TPA: sugar transferase [Miltoncostaeaceae bacterium]|nr:sugar transferase [Miltoncostaeaceae bacterium]
MTTKFIPEPLELRLGDRSSGSTRRRAARARIISTATLVALDIAFTGVVLILAGSVARFPVFGGPLAEGPRLSHAQILAFSLFAPVLIALWGGYSRRRCPLGRLAGASLVGGWISLLAAGVLHENVNGVQTAAAVAVLPLVWSTSRAAVAAVMTPERVLIVGSGRMTQRVEELCRRHPEKGLQVMGFVDEDPHEMASCTAPCLGGIDELERVLVEHEIDRIIVAWSLAGDERIVDILRDCDRQSVEVDVVPRMFDLIGTSPEIRTLGGVSLVGVRPQQTSLAKRATKRAVDVTGSLLLMVIFAPLALLATLAILVFDSRPVFFRQERVGAGGRLFSVVKFRTMRPDAEHAGKDKVDALATGDLSIEEAVKRIKSDSGSQVTGVGRVLRVTSLDELPQLWNVLRGDMSLVGPRPLRPFEVDALGDWQLRRQEVRPGITGLWQVLGRSDINWTERMQLDYTYARHWSIAADMGILFRTVGAVFHRKGSV